MTHLQDLCTHVRSKNAGPFWVTIDLLMTDTSAYNRVASSPAITPGRLARLYSTDPSLVKIFQLTALNAVKISFPRPTGQGSASDRDIHAGQQYVPLLAIDIA